MACALRANLQELVKAAMLQHKLRIILRRHSEPRNASQSRNCSFKAAAWDRNKGGALQSIKCAEGKLREFARIHIVHVFRQHPQYRSFSSLHGILVKPRNVLD